MAAALTRDFGSVDRWRASSSALATPPSRQLGLGSAHLRAARRSTDQSIASDHGQTLPAAFPILALDMYEHAYHIDFGANATAYIAAFMRNIDWNAAQSR